VPLARRDAIDDGIERAVRTARLLANAGAGDAPIVLSDDNATDAIRTKRAGRIRGEDGLSAHEWDAFADHASRVATAVRDATGLRTAFHHHCAGYVETPGEIDALMSRTDASLLGLCLDTGHLSYAGGDPLVTAAQYADRIWHVHFKDCDRSVLEQTRAKEWDYPTAVRNAIFCELGRGTVPFADLRDALQRRNYSGWIVVEQDVLGGRGTPAESARRNRDYLRQLGL
jgi:inosose dehydratase